jgi:predicted Zn finger-like uncharacterized protein
MNIACPQCTLVYRIDPDRVPDGGALTRCRECMAAFVVVTDLAAQQPGTVRPGRLPPPPEPAVSEPDVSAGDPVGTGDRPDEGPGPDGGERAAREPFTGAGVAAAEPPAFGPLDPRTRARRLARALVSDIKVYHPEKWERSHQAGTLRKEFRGEILKSWDEYVEQVGAEMAKTTPFFRDALNDILARGERVF